VIGMALANQARAARQGGAAVRAIELHTRAVETFERGAPWDPTRAAVLEELARAYADAGQLEAAIANAGRAIALTRELNPGDDPMLARRLRARAEIELAAAQRDEAVVDLRAAQDLLRDTGSRFAEDRAEIRALLEGASQ
jgi:tetratricopeptide (TPR) repeat protein